MSITNLEYSSRLLCISKAASNNYMTTRRHRRRTPTSSGVVLTATMLALATSLHVSDVVNTATAFRPPLGTSCTPQQHVYHRRHRIIPPRNDNEKHSSSSRRTPISTISSSTTTSLPMVFDFFKKAQTEASEQMSAFATGLAKSRNSFLYNLEDSIASMTDGKGGNLLDQLEDTLLQADLGMATTEDVLSEARFLREESTQIFTRDDVKALLRGKLLEALGAASSASGGSSSVYNRVQVRAGKEKIMKPLITTVGDDGKEDTTTTHSSVAAPSFALKFASVDDDKPISATKPLTVHFIMGANGMGKTTTIGKLAYRLRTEASQKVLLAACDTFRAGAVAQLEQWATRANVDCFSPSDSTNGPSAVLFGALDKAINEGYDTLLVDTSGRLSNNDALTAELVKMKKVIQKRMSTKFDETTIKPIPNLDVPHETLLVIDAAQGRMALDSAKQWDKELGLTGLILTKLDGSAKGGSVVAVSRELGLPVKLVGIGEGLEDLRDFEPESFVDGLLGIGIAGGGASKSEGKALATRLSQMRKERNERAKLTASIKNFQQPSQSPMGLNNNIGNLMDSMSDIEADMGEMEIITPGGGGAGGGAGSKGKSKNKKKKKGKR